MNQKYQFLQRLGSLDQNTTELVIHMIGLGFVRLVEISLEYQIDVTEL